MSVMPQNGFGHPEVRSAEPRKYLYSYNYLYLLLYMN